MDEHSGSADGGVVDAKISKYRTEREKRLRAEGNAQYLRVEGELGRFARDPFAPPRGEREPLRDEVDVLLIGAGFANLIAATALQKRGYRNFRFVDVASDFGGTWYWNRYPGAMCDVESYIYLPLLEDMGYLPKHKYSHAPEILSHAQEIARRNGFYERAVFQTEVNSLRWDDERARWVALTDRGDQMTARFVISANGPLSRPKLPGIPGIESFRGTSFHTSRWDYGYTGGDAFGNLERLRDKRVGIIGTGATGIQCIPHLGEWAKALFVFQRTPAAVDFRNNQVTDPAWAASLAPGWQRERTENFTALVAGLERDVDLVGDYWTSTFQSLTGAAARKEAVRIGRKLTPEERSRFMVEADMAVMDRIRDRVDAVVKDRKTAEALKPWYKRWCKRPQFHDGYLETFNRPNVRLLDTDGRGVDSIAGNRVLVGGEAYELDCLIFATGFEVGGSYAERANCEVVGCNGRRLSQHWKDGFRTLHGLMTHGFPNAFFVGVTQTGVTVNYPHTVTEQVGHLMFVLDAMRDAGHQVVEATDEGEQGWVDEFNRVARRSVEYYRDCTPGYNTNEGDLEDRRGILASFYGGGPIEFFQILERWRADGAMQGLAFR